MRRVHPRRVSECRSSERRCYGIVTHTTSTVTHIGDLFILRLVEQAQRLASWRRDRRVVRKDGRNIVCQRGAARSGSGDVGSRTSMITER